MSSSVVGNGTNSFTGDGGPATAATVSGPSGVALDGVGNLYISETGNQRIRRVDAKTGIITTIVGNGILGTPKEGVATQTPLDLVNGSLTSDAAGDVYFSKYQNWVGRVDAITGVLTAAAGNHYEGSSGDGGDPTIASVGGPQGVGVDTNGNLYIAEFDGYVRKVTIPRASVPYFSLAGGTYHAPQTLTLTDSLAGATIYYTYTPNGSTPSTGATLYTGPITINTSGIVEAIAIAPGYINSAVASKSYVYAVLPPAAAPYFNLAGGTYHSPQMLTLTDTTPGAAIHYTTNGSTPAAASTLYTGPITIASTETVQPVAI